MKPVKRKKKNKRVKEKNATENNVSIVFYNQNPLTKIISTFETSRFLVFAMVTLHVLFFNL